MDRAAYRADFATHVLTVNAGVPRSTAHTLAFLGTCFALSAVILILRHVALDWVLPGGLACALWGAAVIAYIHAHSAQRLAALLNDAERPSPSNHAFTAQYGLYPVTTAERRHLH